MSKPLTKHEEWLFSFTNSEAISTSGKRAAIRRNGLEGLTREQVIAVQKENWKNLKESNKKTGAPSWVLACREPKSWKHAIPPGIKSGSVIRDSTNKLAEMAFNNIEWGRRRKHGLGYANAYETCVKEETTGWGRTLVVNRWVNYGCVLSPCRTKVAVHLKAGTKWEVHPIWRDHILVDGVRIRLSTPAIKEVNNLRNCVRVLQRAGFNARCVRQTEKKIREGSADNAKNAKSASLVGIVDLGAKLGFYHLEQNQSPRSVVSKLIAVQQQRQATLDELKVSELVKDDKYIDLLLCVNDSYAAGNCKPGTMNFIKANALDPKQHYSLADMMRISNGSFRFVRAAALAALRRVRKEEQQGYCVIAEHRE